MTFFSGSFFPLATLSNIDDHMFFPGSPLLCRFSLLLRIEDLALVVNFRLMIEKCKLTTMPT